MKRLERTKKLNELNGLWNVDEQESKRHFLTSACLYLVAFIFFPKPMKFAQKLPQMIAGQLLGVLTEVGNLRRAYRHLMKEADMCSKKYPSQNRAVTCCWHQRNRAFIWRGWQGPI